MDLITIIRSSLTQIVTSVVRQLLIAGTTWLVTKNLLDQPTANQLLSLLPIVIASIAWASLEHLFRTKAVFNRVVVAAKDVSVPAHATTEQTLVRVDEEIKKQKENSK